MRYRARFSNKQFHEPMELDFLYFKLCKNSHLVKALIKSVSYIWLPISIKIIGNITQTVKSFCQINGWIKKLLT